MTMKRKILFAKERISSNVNLALKNLVYLFDSALAYQSYNEPEIALRGHLIH